MGAVKEKTMPALLSSRIPLRSPGRTVRVTPRRLVEILSDPALRSRYGRVRVVPPRLGGRGLGRITIEVKGAPHAR